MVPGGHGVARDQVRRALPARCLHEDHLLQALAAGRHRDQRVRELRPRPRRWDDREGTDDPSVPLV